MKAFGIIALLISIPAFASIPEWRDSAPRGDCPTCAKPLRVARMKVAVIKLSSEKVDCGYRDISKVICDQEIAIPVFDFIHNPSAPMQDIEELACETELRGKPARLNVKGRVLFVTSGGGAPVKYFATKPLLDTEGATPEYLSFFTVVSDLNLERLSEGKFPSNAPPFPDGGRDWNSQRCAATPAVEKVYASSTIIDAGGAP